MESTKTSVSVGGGTSFCNLLFLTFLVLKLTNVIDWSWWWVTAPLWIPVAIAFAILVVVVFCYVVCAGISSRKDRWS